MTLVLYLNLILYYYCKVMKKLDENELKLNANKEFIKAYQMARQMMKSKNYSNAILTLDYLLKSKENQIERSLRIDMFQTVAFSYFYLYKYSESVEHFEKALEICKIYMSEYNTEKLGFLKYFFKLLLGLNSKFYCTYQRYTCSLIILTEQKVTSFVLKMC
jgi:tetratricopeptide (TPR) repeat protein